MTAGEDALREAARAESARIYGRTQREVDADHRMRIAVAQIEADDEDVIIRRRQVLLETDLVVSDDPVVIPLTRAREAS